MKKPVKSDIPATMPSLFATTLRSISAMPIVLTYRATLQTIRQFTRQQDTIFSRMPSLAELSQEAELRAQPGYTYTWTEDDLDPADITAEFLAVENERQALDFLRHTGDFLPFGDEISWSDFKRWQNLTRLVRERTTLSAVQSAAMQSKTAADNLDPSGEIRHMLRLLSGYDHMYFPPPPEPTAKEIADLKRAATGDTETPQHAAERERQALDSLRKGDQRLRRLQRDLELWFATPPPKAYSIAFVPRTSDPTRESLRGVGGIVAELLYSPDELPVLHIRATCSLEAIAATLYADRVAGISIVKCARAGCPTLFTQHGLKTFCSLRCKNRVNTKAFRDTKATKPTKRRKRKPQPPRPSK